MNEDDLIVACENVNSQTIGAIVDNITSVNVNGQYYTPSKCA